MRSHCFGILFLCVATTGAAHAQRIPFPAELRDTATVARGMRSLATDLLSHYISRNRVEMLDNQFRLQLVAGRYVDAARTIAQLRALRTGTARAWDAQYAIWAGAMARSAKTGEPFDAAFGGAFREAFRSFDNNTATLVMRGFAFPTRTLQGSLRTELDKHKSDSDISQSDALALVRAYQRVEAHTSFAPLVMALFNEDDARRYITERDVRVRMADGATVCALIMRPRSAAQRAPTLLTFTIYVDSAVNVSDGRRAAANGYAGVVGFTRGKVCSPENPVPYRYDGQDAAALIDWIAAQPWSDGRVGMYGGSYTGATTWGAVKHMPKALKAIMVGAPVAPGLDVPSEGNIPWNFIYPWPFYTTNNKTLDIPTYFDNNRWFKLNREWYISGRAYRDLPAIDGTPNPIWQEWIAHPSYDEYWQAMIPYRAEFAKVNIPVLQTAGYYFGGPGAALYYFNEHYKYNRAAQHYLLIGPYDHFPAQRGVVDALGDTATMFSGYEIDRAARIDIVGDLRYQWFDWILRGGPKPALLKDRVNYEVMGANTWRHAPSIAAMSNGTLRFYLTKGSSDNSHRLTRAAGATDSSVGHRVDLSYRKDIDSTFAGGNLRDTAINAYEALTFISEPLDAVELSGLYSGHLAFMTNKKDFDLTVALFELTTRGEYIQLPPLQLRASYARDLTTRQLLVPNERQSLDFRSIRLMSRKIERGSRIVAVIGPLKSPQQEINYGAGKVVSEETIKDAGSPLELRWFGNSYIELPIRH